jgi:hypothetical protein
MFRLKLINNSLIYQISYTKNTLIYKKFRFNAFSQQSHWKLALGSPIPSEAKEWGQVPMAVCRRQIAF